ncbi:hypothetical protein CHUAL_009465 [Chamberlinius hualienensis]
MASENDSELKYRYKFHLPQTSNQSSEYANHQNGGVGSMDPEPATIHVGGSLTQDEIQESMDNLKQKLDVLKSMVESDNHLSAGKKTPTFVDEHILSVVFGVALVAIVSVTIYAFQALYVAVTRKRV